MPHYRRTAFEDGFSLTELLVVIVLVGVLAGIALPQFLGHGARARDGEAKANARNLMGELEACYVDTRAYDAPACSPPSGSGLPLGSDRGQVEIVTAGTTASTFEIVGHSRSGHDFFIRKLPGGGLERTCVAPEGSDPGGCQRGSW